MDFDMKARSANRSCLYVKVDTSDRKVNLAGLHPGHSQTEIEVMIDGVHTSVVLNGKVCIAHIEPDVMVFVMLGSFEWTDLALLGEKVGNVVSYASRGHETVLSTVASVVPLDHVTNPV